MSVVNLTFVRETYIAGTKYAPAATLDVATGLAADLVWQGRATYTTPPAQAVQVDSNVNINASQIADAGAQGRTVLQAGTFDQLLTAMGASLGAADSGGTGFKAIRVPNATT